MSDAAPRITAGYDADAPREWIFPRADAALDDAAPAGDAAALAPRLASALGALLGVTVSATALTASGDAGRGWVAADGAAFAASGGAMLAAALLNRQCGGAFEAGGGSASMHVERCRAGLIEGLRDLMMSDAGGWNDAAALLSGTAFAVEAGGISDRIDVALVPAAAAPADPGSGEWRGRLGALLADFAVPVRLVLHDGTIAVRAARALGVGDVLPIATAHEVGLRVGSLAWARGHIVDTDGIAGVRIVSRSARPMEAA